MNLDVIEMLFLLKYSVFIYLQWFLKYFNGMGYLMEQPLYIEPFFSKQAEHFSKKS